MSKFKQTGKLGMLEGRGWKWNEIAEKVALVLIEKACGSQYSLTSASVVLLDLSLPWTLLYIMKGSLIHCKVKLIQGYYSGDWFYD